MLSEKLSKSKSQEPGLQQVEKCVNDLLSQAIDLRKLLNKTLKEEEQSSEHCSNSDIPQKVLYSSIVQKKTKQLICKTAESKGILTTAKEFDIPSSLIERWLREMESKVLFFEPKEDLLKGGVKRSCPDVVKDENSNSNSNEMKRTEAENMKIAEIVSNNSHSKRSRKHNISKSRKKQEPIFSILTTPEKYRLVYDYVCLGMGSCERKWGVDRHSIYFFIKTQKVLGETPEARQEWVDTQEKYIAERRRSIDKVIGRNNIEYALEKKGEEKITLHELCNLSFDRGIALAAVRYSVNLFELELVLQSYCPVQWKEMNQDEWYLPPHTIQGGHTKLDVVNLAQRVGYMYSTKTFRVPEREIRKYFQLYYKGATGKSINGKKRPRINGNYINGDGDEIKGENEEEQSSKSSSNESSINSSFF